MYFYLCDLFTGYIHEYGKVVIWPFTVNKFCGDDLGFWLLRNCDQFQERRSR